MKKAVLLVTVIVAFTLMCSASALAVTRCVNTGGTGGCYSLIQDAVNGSSAYDVINVYEGRYNENVLVNINNLTIKGVKAVISTKKGLAGTTITDADPTNVIVDAYDNCSGNRGFDVTADYFTLKNMTVRLACSKNIYIDGNNAWIEKVYSIGAEYDGIRIDGDYATVKNSNVSGNFAEGIQIEGSYATVMNNTVLNNYESGIVVDGMECSYSTITGNTVSVSGDSCIWLKFSDFSTITSNKVNACGDHGIAVLFSDNVTVSNNTVRSANDWGILLIGTDSSAASGNTIESSEEGGIFAVWVEYSTISSNIITSVTRGEGIKLEDIENSLVTNNTISDTRDEGIDSMSDYEGCYAPNTFSNNKVKNSGRDAFEIEENCPTITGNSAMNSNDDNGFDLYCYDDEWDNCGAGQVTNNYAGYNTWGEGIDIDALGWTISGNTTEYNMYGGFWINGNNNTVASNIARYNGYDWDEGFWIEGSNNSVSGNTATDNNGDGFYVITVDWSTGSPVGGSNTLLNNTATNNFLSGFSMWAGWYGESSSLSFSNNTADKNGEGIAIQHTLDGFSLVSITGNKASNNHTNYCSDFNGNIDTFTGNLSNGAPIALNLPNCEINGP